MEEVSILSKIESTRQRFYNEALNDKVYPKDSKGMPVKEFVNNGLIKREYPYKQTLYCPICGNILQNLSHNDSGFTYKGTFFTKVICNTREFVDFRCRCGWIYINNNIHDEGLNYDVI